ncbi:type IV conjugative transfer system protein TraL [Vibrio coralliilyticus]|uniref:Type IV conjugative transfer system protein TraL n=1 Tax=Vibrio coralliilyticus TaxID=190893 RepID=A0AAP6ZV95_9VIBR|nr:type IV conjugative transfer system protein TraL [Vibrio coralliilyticus]NOI31834.1 type IV conjugative transfer system protein TraL [Vibrio coralliilyticus]NOJ25278.1 type IV conjugative transfer system protein TraL [Vibrio coralliilyticus]
MSQEPIDMPDLIDEPFHFLIWQFDEICIVTIGVMLGIVINSPMLGLLIGYVGKVHYTRMRDGKPRGYFLHRLREVGFAYEKPNRHSSMQPPLVSEWKS